MKNTGSVDFKKIAFERLYEKYNRREFVHPDPLEFLYNYNELRDREIAGLVASSLAYGRVAQIIKSVAKVLDKMAPSPFRFIEDASFEFLCTTFHGFKHRFSTGDEVASMLYRAKNIMSEYGSMYMFFKDLVKRDAETILPALCDFSEELTGDSSRSSLLPSPSKNSACKRLNLFMRWMIRHDDVDPGGWDDISPSLLVVPLDVHMHRIGLKLGLTNRRQADIKAALEITNAFREISPGDPVRYDFALTRLGIRNDMDMGSLLCECGVKT
jgi:uncharacterized protein (TIGR02757 family)